MMGNTDDDVASLWHAMHDQARDTRPSLEVPTPNPTFDGQSENLQKGLQTIQTQFVLSSSQLDAFSQNRFIRLTNVIPTAVLVGVRARLQTLASSATGGRDVSLPAPVPSSSSGSERDSSRSGSSSSGSSTSGTSSVTRPPPGSSAAEIDQWWSLISEPAVRSWHMQMMWAIDPTIRALVLSPRIGTIVCQLLGCTR